MGGLLCGGVTVRRFESLSGLFGCWLCGVARGGDCWPYFGGGLWLCVWACGLLGGGGDGTEVFWEGVLVCVGWFGVERNGTEWSVTKLR